MVRLFVWMEASDKMDARLRRLREDDIEMVRMWRMHPEITKYMYTDPVISAEDQRRWYKRINESEDVYWIIEQEGVPVGLASLVEWDKNNNIVMGNSYIVERNKDTLKLAVNLQINMFYYAFEIMKVNKVYGEIMAENVGVLRSLELCGSKQEGVLREKVYKNGKYHDIVMHGIIRSDWEAMQERVKSKMFVNNEF